MGIDYNEVAAYLESLQVRFNRYKAQRVMNLLFSILAGLVVLVGVLLVVQPTFPRILLPIMLMLLASMALPLVIRVWRTNAQASALEKEVELLRYRLVADDVALEKLKNDEKPKRDDEITFEELAASGRVQIGDDGELVITPTDINHKPKRFTSKNEGV